MLSVLTGSRQVGKTSWLKLLVKEMDAEGLSLFGFITPAVFEGDTKTGIDAMLFPSRETFEFAKLANAHSDEKSMAPLSAKDQNPRAHWDFSDEAMGKINSHLSSVGAGDLAGKVFLVDELGPLEMIRGEGITEAMRILDGGLFDNAIVVIRPELLDEAERRWGAAPGGYEVIDPGTRPSFL
ncbi:MAG: nucleoside-triphosphatase [Coriobacteriales bacterium]|jgi:nucleoside-triphosphatase THEP1